MKKVFKQIQIPLAIALFFFAAGLVSAADSGDMVKCAVCGKEMTKADARITYVYNDKTYYFASEKCKESFVKDPEKFLDGKCCMKETACCPGCGMGMKKGDAKIAFEYKGQTYTFCCEKCKDAFAKEPEKFLKTVFTCPMHPGATTDKPGKCPRCGKDLEKKIMACGMRTGGCCPMMMKGHGMRCCRMMMRRGEGGCCHMKMRCCGARREEAKMKNCGRKESCAAVCGMKTKAVTGEEEKDQK